VIVPALWSVCRKGRPRRMEELKLFMITDLGATPCWFLIPARNSEEALMKCINDKKCPISKERQSNCKVEELRIEGYTIKVVKND